MDTPYARVEQLETGVERLLAHNPSAFTFTGTQSYIVGIESVAVIDPGSGNLASVRRAFERAAGEEGIALDLAVTTDPEAVRAAERVVLPGQGAFAACARGLAALPGMEAALRESALERGRRRSNRR